MLGTRSTTRAATVHIVPHTHWDREWYAPFQVFRAALVELWDELLTLCEGDPDFRFLMDGQSVVIEDYLSVRPEMHDRLVGAVQRGQIQVGPWYSLPDEFLVSGETLVRDLERGLAVGDAHGGAMRVGYLPDSFGHASQMPQIYRQFGFSHAVVWRGVPSKIDRLAFEWEAPDGSRILTAYMGTSYSQGVDLPLSGKALALRIETVMRSLEPYRPSGDVLLMNGNDHVLPQARLSSAVKAAQTELGETRVRLARLTDYLEQLSEDGWPWWKGELRASSRANVLMGTLSVRIPDKQVIFRAVESLERYAEPLAALSGNDSFGLLKEAWTNVLQNAAHDTACGSAVDDVAVESRMRSQAALQLAGVVTERSLKTLVRPLDGFTAWNPSPFTRNEVVEVESSEVPAGAQLLESLGGKALRFRFSAQEVDRLLAVLNERRIAGEVVRRARLTRSGNRATIEGELAHGGPQTDLEEIKREAERLAGEGLVESFDLVLNETPYNRVLVESGPVPGFGLRVIERTPRERCANPVTVGEGRLRNRFLDCRLQPDGTLSVQTHADGRTYEPLNYLVDEADAGDEYNFQPLEGDRPLTPKLESSRVLEPGPLRGTLEAYLRLDLPVALSPERRSRSERRVEAPLRLQLSIDALHPRIDFQLELENVAEDHRLRAGFPLPFAPTESWADGVFDVVRRPVRKAWHEASAPEWELPTYPMRSFVDVSDGRSGLLATSEGLHEFEVTPGPTPRLYLTLLRAVGWLSRDDLTYRIGHAGPPLPTPGAQVQGPQMFRYSLTFHEGDWQSACAWRLAEQARLPFRLTYGVPAGRLGLEISPECIQLTACVPRTNGYDLRLLNASDRRAEASLQIDPLPISVRRMLLGGTEVEEIRACQADYRLEMRPWEIATVRVEVERA